MFKIAAEPTFEATLNIVGQGREQELKVTYKHMKRTEYQALVKSIQSGETTAADAVLQLVVAWDADAEFSQSSLKELIDNQPGIEWALITGFGEAFTVARKGN